MLNSIHRSKRFTKGWKDEERGPRFYAIDPLYERAVRGTRVKRNRRRAAGGSRKGKEASWDTRVNLSPRSIPSTGRVSMRKKKKKEKIYSSLRKSTCHDEKLLRFSYWRLLKCVHDFLFFFKFPKTFLELRLRLLSIFRSKRKYTKDSAPRISKIFKINILA